MADSSNAPPYAAKALELMQQDWQSIGKDAAAVEKTSDEILEDVTALMLVRLVGVVAPLGTYPDLSVVSICKNVIQKQRDWPLEVSDDVIAQLKEFCHRMIRGYKDVPYHNQEHAHHVVMSTCKLLELVLHVPKKDNKVSAASGGAATAKCPSYGLRNDPLMLFVQVFAALIHDVEHQGRCTPSRSLSLAHEHTIDVL